MMYHCWSQYVSIRQLDTFNLWVTKKEILLFTKLVPQADCCDLGDESTINQTDLIIPVPWVKCEGIYKKVDAPILYWLEGDAQRKIYLQKM